VSTPGTGSSRPQIVPQDAALRDRDSHLDSLKAAIGRLAHDFNNALVPVLGYISLAKEDISPGSGAANFVTAAENGARKMERQLDAILLAVFPHRKFKSAPVNLNELIQTEVNACKETLPPEARVDFSLGLSPCTVPLDAQQWQIVLQNLLRNACRAMPKGGKIQISLLRTTMDEGAAAQLGVAPGVFAHLTIKDNGAGMDATVLQRCFEPFFSTLPKNKAAGLGLTTLHSICRLHGGQCRIASEAASGTTVEIWLPLNPPAA
jgi:two-component system cell cycle sensor histidine kinase/response regulator CckA